MALVIGQGRGGDEGPLGRCGVRHNTGGQGALWGASTEPREEPTMTHLQRRIVRSLTLLFAAALLGACHFHGHHGGCGGWGGPRYYVPVRHCR